MNEEDKYHSSLGMQMELAQDSVSPSSLLKTNLTDASATLPVSSYLPTSLCNTCASASLKP